MGLIVALPAYGDVNKATVSSLFDLAYSLGRLGVPDVSFSTYSLPDIADLRNLFATAWYDTTKAKYLLQIDRDMRFPYQLVTEMLMLDKPVVGTLYRKKTEDYKLIGEVELGAERIGAFTVGKKVGGGVLLIRRDVVDTMLAQMPEVSVPARKSDLGNIIAGAERVLHIFDKLDTVVGTLSEDYAFCHRCRECGIPIWVNTVHPVGHLGEKEYEFPAPLDN